MPLPNKKRVISFEEFEGLTLYQRLIESGPSGPGRQGVYLRFDNGVIVEIAPTFESRVMITLFREPGIYNDDED